MSGTPPLSPFAALLGRWRTTGTVVDAAGTPTARVDGTDEYELMVGGRWVLHRVDVRLGPDRARALELIGAHDPRTGTWAAHAFDADGSYSSMAVSRGEDGSWRFTADDVRAVLLPHPTGSSMSATWHRRSPESPGTWLPWMDLAFTREPLSQSDG